MKIAFITTYCSYYVERTYELLSKAADIKYYFHTKGRPWKWQEDRIQFGENLIHEYLRGFQFLGRRITPSLIPKLWLGNYDIFIQSIINPFAIMVSYLISRIKGKPYIVWTEIWMRLRSPYHRLVFPVLHLIYRDANAIITIGDHVKQYHISEGIDKEKIFVAPYAVDNSKYNFPVPEEDLSYLRQQLDIEPEMKIVLNLGRLEQCKGIEYLIEAYKLLNRDDSVLIIAGKGSMVDNLKRLAETKGIKKQVRFPGYVSANKIVVYYALAWCYVIPSITTTTIKETWGLVVNEAFNQGVPVVATEAVGAAAGGLVQDGVNGFIVPERDSQALARAIACLLDDAKLHRQMSKQAKELILRWTQERMAEGIRQAIKFVSEREKEM